MNIPSFFLLLENMMSLSHLSLVLLVMAIWGFSFVVISLGLAEISPLMLCLVRFFFTCFPAIFFVARPLAPFRLVMMYGLVVMALQFSLLFIGMKTGMTAGLASLVMQVQVFFTMILAVLFLNEKINVWQVLGALVAFFGLGIIGFNMGVQGSLLGFLLVFIAAGMWGYGNMLTKKLGSINMLSLVVWGSLFAWPPMLLMVVYVEGAQSIIVATQHLSWTLVGAIVYMVLPNTLFGFSVWSWLLSRHPIITIAPFTLLVPVAGMLSAVWILNEPLQTWKMWAAAFIVLGLCIHLWAPSKNKICYDLESKG